MLGLYLASLGATNLQKSRKKVSRLSILLRLAMKIPFMPIGWWKTYASFSKNTFYDKVSDSAMFLIFHQISGSCSYKIVHIKKNVYKHKENNQMI